MTSLIQQLGAGLREQLGEILVRRGALDRQTLADAVPEAARRGIRLGEHLLELGLVTERDIALALSDQFGLRHVSIDPREIDISLADLMHSSTAQRLQVLPLYADEHVIGVAVADPTDVLLADELRLILDRPVEIVVAERSDIAAGIAQRYASTSVWAENEFDGFRTLEADRRETVIDAADVQNGPAVEAVNALLRRAIELRASDLHLIPRRDDLLVRVRVDGVMRDLDTISFDGRAAVVARLKVMAQLDIAERRLPQDGRVAIRLADTNTDLRIAVLPATSGENVVIRIAYIEGGGIGGLENLGLDDGTADSLRRSLSSTGGAVIVAGPTGSGKTTTLYAALKELNDGTRSIVTIEDPVERVVDGTVQVEVNPRAGLTFARGLRTILRADPDVILVGEIRDAETAQIAMEAAMTGHLVLTTLHAESAAAALVRLRELGIPAATIASSLRLVLSQRLLRKVCDVCRNESEGSWRGCPDCGFSGYRGRIAAYESLELDDDVRALVASGSDDLAALAGRRITPTLRQRAEELAATGVTTGSEVIRVCGETRAAREPSSR
jgi:type IV pilus assembly protein PilB